MASEFTQQALIPYYLDEFPDGTPFGALGLMSVMNRHLDESRYLWTSYKPMLTSGQLEIAATYMNAPDFYRFGLQIALTDLEHFRKAQIDMRWEQALKTLLNPSDIVGLMVGFGLRMTHEAFRALVANYSGYPFMIQHQWAPHWSDLDYMDALKQRARPLRYELRGPRDQMVGVAYQMMERDVVFIDDGFIEVVYEGMTTSGKHVRSRDQIVRHDYLNTLGIKHDRRVMSDGE